MEILRNMNRIIVVKIVVFFFQLIHELILQLKFGWFEHRFVNGREKMLVFRALVYQDLFKL